MSRRENKSPVRGVKTEQRDYVCYPSETQQRAVCRPPAFAVTISLLVLFRF